MIPPVSTGSTSASGWWRTSCTRRTTTTFFRFPSVYPTILAVWWKTFSLPAALRYRTLRHLTIIIIIIEILVVCPTCSIIQWHRSLSESGPGRVFVIIFLRLHTPHHTFHETGSTVVVVSATAHWGIDGTYILAQRFINIIIINIIIIIIIIIIMYRRQLWLPIWFWVWVWVYIDPGDPALCKCVRCVLRMRPF